MLRLPALLAVVLFGLLFAYAAGTFRSKTTSGVTIVSLEGEPVFNPTVQVTKFEVSDPVPVETTTVDSQALAQTSDPVSPTVTMEVAATATRVPATPTVKVAVVPFTPTLVLPSPTATMVPPTPTSVTVVNSPVVTQSNVVFPQPQVFIPAPQPFVPMPYYPVLPPVTASVVPTPTVTVPATPTKVVVQTPTCDPFPANIVAAQSKLLLPAGLCFVDYTLHPNLTPSAEVQNSGAGYGGGTVWYLRPSGGIFNSVEGRTNAIAYERCHAHQDTTPNGGINLWALYKVASGYAEGPDYAAIVATPGYSQMAGGNVMDEFAEACALWYMFPEKLPVYEPANIVDALQKYFLKYLPK